MHELPLVFFTVLAQSAIGITLFATLGRLAEKVDLVTYRKALCIALGTMAIGGIASMFHLGQPLRAFNALFGFGRSPMSNEIISVILFSSSLFVTLICSLICQSRLVQVVTYFLVTVTAIILMFVIPMVYRISTIPQWDTIFTPMQMILTSFSIGAVVLFALSGARLFAYLSIISLLTSLVVTSYYFVYVANIDFMLLSDNILSWGLKLILAALTILTVVYFKPNKITFAAMAVALVAMSELIGRVAFFDLWQIGM